MANSDLKHQTLNAFLYFYDEKKIKLILKPGERRHFASLECEGIVRLKLDQV
jgi:hypothetical protein